MLTHVKPCQHMLTHVNPYLHMLTHHQHLHAMCIISSACMLHSNLNYIENNNPCKFRLANASWYVIILFIFWIMQQEHRIIM